MKYFRVERQQIVGDIVSGEVYADGEFVGLPDTIEPNETKVLGYVVYESNDNGIETGAKYYDDLSDIKNDHPPTEWQNDKW